MEDGDVNFSNPEVFPGSSDLPGSCSMDSFFDDIFEDTQACTHTHICNPPGTDLPHSHTCYHVHHKIFSPPTEESADSIEKNPANKRSSGNREAVKKYREKKKARTASLEEEMAQLRAVNQQLMQRLQGQAALEAEVARLRCLLVDIRGRIEGEIGSFPYQKSGNAMLQGNLMGGIGGAHVLSSCDDLRCEDQAYCLPPGIQGNGGGEVVAGNDQGCGGPCEMRNIQCMGSSAAGSKEHYACGRGKGMSAGCSANIDKIIGKIPGDIGNCESLGWLDLRSNMLTGAMPGVGASLSYIFDPQLCSDKHSGYLSDKGDDKAWHADGLLIEFEGVTQERLENFDPFSSCGMWRMQWNAFNSIGGMFYMNLA